MSAPQDGASISFHASLNVSDLRRSVGFYRVLLGCDPAKEFPDYVKFELQDPPLILSLIPGTPGSGGNLNHVGLRVRESGTLVQIQHRLEAAGFATQREDGVECCHSRQTKFWVRDPDSALWEIYIFHEEESEHHEPQAPGGASENSFAKAVPRPRLTWHHHIPDAIPIRIPHADNTLDDVNLEGTANLECSTTSLGSLLEEAFRVLRPGGMLTLHGLASDAPLVNFVPSLPGPAAAVQRVPSVAEVARALDDAGYFDIRLERLSAKAHFEIEGIGLREILLSGRKPGHRPRTTNHRAVYLGPFAEVRDDFGNVFRRGERVSLNVHDWLALENSSIAVQFLLLPPG